MPIHVILFNAPDSELAREIIEVPASIEDPEEVTNIAIHEAIDSWVLNVGDSISIVEVP